MNLLVAEPRRKPTKRGPEAPLGMVSSCGLFGGVGLDGPEVGGEVEVGEVVVGNPAIPIDALEQSSGVSGCGYWIGRKQRRRTGRRSKPPPGSTGHATPPPRRPRAGWMHGYSWHTNWVPSPALKPIPSRAFHSPDRGDYPRGLAFGKRAHLTPEI